MLTLLVTFLLDHFQAGAGWWIAYAVIIVLQIIAAIIGTITKD